MACQTVGESNKFFFRLLKVTIQTPTHIHLHIRLGDRHPCHITMAVFAIDARCQVSLMAEIDEIRLPAYAEPGDWLTALPVTSQDLDSGIVSRDDAMAAHTLLHRRDTGDV